MVNSRSLPIWLFALALLVALVGLSPRAHQAGQAMQAAQQAAALGKPAEAAAHLVQAAEHYPWRADLWELAGRYALQAGDHRAAMLYLMQAEARAAHGLTAQGQLALGDAYLASGQTETALDIWRQVAQHENGRPQALARIAAAWRDLGDYSAATTALQTLAASQPEDAQAHFQMGLLLAIGEDFDAAKNALARAAELDPALSQKVVKMRDKILQAQLADNPAYTPVLLCQALASIEEWALAAEACRQGVASSPDYAEAWAYLGLTYLQQSARMPPGGSPPPSDGRAELEQALALDPHSLAANTFMALYWAHHNQNHRAAAAMQTAVELAPDKPDGYVDLGEMLARTGDLDGAYQAYLQAIDIAPQDLKYQGYLVDFSLRYNYRVEEIALPVARQLVISAPQNPAHLDRMAQVMIKLGDLASAERFLLRALQADPAFAPAHLHLGFVYILLENFHLAQQHLLRAVSLAPETPTAEQARRLYETYFP